MTLTMDRPTLLMPRWHGHGDIRVAQPEHPAGPFFHAGDTCELLEIDVERMWNATALVWHYRWPATVTHIAGVSLRTEDDYPSDFFTLVDTKRVAENHVSHLTADFLLFISDLIESIFEAGLAQIIDDAAPTPRAALGATYSVRLSAQILSRDPAIDLGRDSLFELMRNVGWVQRVDGIWMPDENLVKLGYVIKQGKRVPGRKELYPQIRITVDGIRELHKRLNGVAALSFTGADDATLLEL